MEDLGLQPQGWVIGIVRTIFAHIDYVIYSLIKLILYGIFDLSTLTTSSDLMNGIYKRIYVLLGIFMAFKLSFSFFQYIVDPESMNGKSEKGVSKLIMRIAVMIIALVGLPTILFNGENGGIVYRAQTAFLPMVPRVLLGINDGTGVASGNDSDIETAANTMAVATLQAFFYVPENLDVACGDGTIADTPPIRNLGDFLSNVNLECHTGINVLGVGAPIYYKYNYNWGISTIVGILLAVMLLGVTLDIAKRVFKMIILEAVAPVPIMSLIDPKSTKDGAFASWIKSLISTFLDIFIKLGLLYLILTLIQLIVSNGLFENYPKFTEHPLRASYLTVFLILGLIFFAKEAPKFIKDSLGIKDSKNGSESFMGKLGGALAGGATGAVAGAISGRGLRGALTGAATGASAGYQNAGTGKPSNAWATARDAAGAARTGDKNYKGGFANAAARWTTEHQRRKMAQKMGVTADTLAVAKAEAQRTASESAKAKDMYDRLVHGQMDEFETHAQMMSLNYEDLGGGLWRNRANGQVETAQEALYRNMSDKETTATKASKNYEKASKVAETYGLNRTPEEEWGMSARRRERYNSRRRRPSNIDRVNDFIDRSARRGGFDPRARDRQGERIADDSNIDSL